MARTSTERRRRAPDAAAARMKPHAARTGTIRVARPSMNNRSFTDEDSELLSLPDRLRAHDVELTRSKESVALQTDSVSFFFPKLADTQGDRRLARDYELELLFFACLLLDIGLTELADNRQRFVFAGANLAADYLGHRGWDSGRVDEVWQAIALHSSPGIAERRGLIGALTLCGLAIEVIGGR